MYKILFLLLLSTQIFAQSLKEKIVGEWVKDEVKLADGSSILKDDVKTLKLRYIFMKNDSFQVTVNGKTGRGIYSLNGDILKISESKFKIEQVNDIKLTMQAIVDSAIQSKALKLIFIPANLHNVGFFPTTFRTKGQDTIYVSKQNYLEPYFLDAEQSAAQFISDRFYFPDYSVGDFYVRFIITKQAEIKGIEVLNSTHEKYNKYLIKAIKASQGKWLPATWEGKPVNAEIKMGFDLGWSERQEAKNKKSNTAPKDTIDSNESNFYLMQGNINVEEKRYAAAIKNLSRSLDLDPLNIDAYYARAGVYALTKDTQKMCVDLLQLKHLEQAKGTALWKKFCDGKK
jgi:tetratricopeptide (TPR) repeat protein